MWLVRWYLIKHTAGALSERRDGSSREKTEGDLGRIWVQPFPSFTLICYNCAGFFLYTSFYLLNRRGGGGVRYETEEKEALPSAGEKILNLPHFCSLSLSL